MTDHYWTPRYLVALGKRCSTWWAGMNAYLIIIAFGELPVLDSPIGVKSWLKTGTSYTQGALWGSPEERFRNSSVIRCAVIKCCMIIIVHSGWSYLLLFQADVTVAAIEHSLNWLRNHRSQRCSRQLWIIANKQLFHLIHIHHAHLQVKPIVPRESRLLDRSYLVRSGLAKQPRISGWNAHLTMTWRSSSLLN